MHLNVQPNGEVFQCCMAPHDRPVGDVTKNTLPEIWNNHSMKDIRRKMVKGIKPKLCQRCFMMEDNGVASPRNTFNEFFKKDIKSHTRHTDESGHNNKFILKYWDFRWSNICNFKCRMCGTFASSKWEEDEKALHGQTYGGLNNFRAEAKEDVFKYVDQFIDDVEEVYFAGGEPLMMDEHYVILEELERRGRFDVRLIYNSNFTQVKLKDRMVFDYWKKFDSVAVGASLDAMGPRAEYIRKGTEWEVVEDNRRKMMETCPRVDFYISPTLRILNAMHFQNPLLLCLVCPLDAPILGAFHTSL
jgi:MoaA/NifB/PqqE/SkfB family radical SAM enzyme